MEQSCFKETDMAEHLRNEGLLLKRRALEIADLEDRILDEFKENAGEVEGIVTIGGQFLEPVNTENLEYKLYVSLLLR